MVGNTPVLVSSYSCKWSLGFARHHPTSPKSLAWFIRLAQHNGLDGVQIADNVNPEDFSNDEVRRLNSLAESFGMCLQWGFADWERRKFERMVEISTMCGARVLRGVVGSAIIQNLSEQERVGAVMDEIIQVLPLLQQTGVILAIENHFDLTVSELAALVSRIDSPHVRICTDVTNGFGELLRPDETVRALAPWSVSMHLKDYTVNKVIGGYEILGVPIGQGEQDSRGIISQMLKQQPDIEVCIELGMPRPASLDGVWLQEESQVRTSAENTVAYLRQFYERGKNGTEFNA